jgi:urea transport system substrate-binding protein
MSNSLSKRLFAGMAAASLGLAVTACGGDDKTASNVEYDDTVTVGILHSLTGTMAISESTLVDTEKMAIDEINAAGGVEVDGKKYKIEYIVEDGASDWPTFAEKSKKLIDQDSVPVVFGGWTSASRKAMLPVYESKDAFLYYPIQYEAQECSNNIFYTGCNSEPAVGAGNKIHV